MTAASSGCEMPRALGLGGQGHQMTVSSEQKTGGAMKTKAE